MQENSKIPKPTFLGYYLFRHYIIKSALGYVLPVMLSSWMFESLVEEVYEN
jgi:hypothetical protein